MRQATVRHVHFRDGRFALVANRAEGTVSLFTIEGKTVSQTDRRCANRGQRRGRGDYPDGRTALAMCATAGISQYFASNAETFGRQAKLSTCRKTLSRRFIARRRAGCYRGLRARPPDIDAVTVVDLTQDPPRTTDFVPVARPESLEISPTGNCSPPSSSEAAISRKAPVSRGRREARHPRAPR